MGIVFEVVKAVLFNIAAIVVILGGTVCVVFAASLAVELLLCTLFKGKQ